MLNEPRLLSLQDIHFLVREQDISLFKSEPAQSLQSRTEQAVTLAVETNRAGYNLYLGGAHDQEKKAQLLKILAKYNGKTPPRQDIAYAYNFRQPEAPQVLFFPKNQAKNFAKQLATCLKRVYRANLKLATNEDFVRERKILLDQSRRFEKATVQAIALAVKEHGFTAMYSNNDQDISFDLGIEVNDEVQLWEEYDLEQRSSSAQNEHTLNAQAELYQQDLAHYAKSIAAIRHKQYENNERLARLAKKKLRSELKKIFHPLIATVQNYPNKGLSFQDSKKILRFIRNCQIDLYQRTAFYQHPFKTLQKKEAFFNRYKINVLTNRNKDSKDTGIVYQSPADFEALFGTITVTSSDDYDADCKHLWIHGGALHSARDGILLVSADEVLVEEANWEKLMHSLEQQTITPMQSPDTSQSIGLFQPEAIPFNGTVILLGSEYLYANIAEHEERFLRLFKVHTEFADAVHYTKNSAKYCIDSCLTYCKSEHNLNLTDGALVELLSYAVKDSGSQHFLSSRFSALHDLIAEAATDAQKTAQTTIDRQTIRNVVSRQYFLKNLLIERQIDELRLHEIMLAVSGTAIGTVNGLAVEEYADLTLGVPMLITAQASAGTSGIISIEREAGLGQAIYNKAHFIISSLIRKKYAEDIPLALAASISFEQLYGQLDGDSASCAEFCALVSAIAQLPLRQDIAITGSLNQHGVVQPVGAVSEKIEAFYRACQTLGFSATQGVIIPESCIHTLFLPQEIETAIDEKRFFLWSIRNIDEALALLSGRSTDDINSLVSTRLGFFEERSKRVYTKEISD